MLVERVHRDLETEVQVQVVDELADALLLEQAVDVTACLRAERSLRMARPTVVLMNCLLNSTGFGVRDVLIVVGSGHVEHGAGVAQTDRRKRFHLLGFERHEHFFDVGEDAAFTLGA